MPKKKRTTRNSSRLFVSAFLRRPLVQVGIVAVAALVIWILVASAGGTGGTASALATNINVHKAYAMYQDGAFFVDVRELLEWNEYHAPGSKLIPLGELASRVNEVPRDKPIVVVCRSGNRSQQGRDILFSAGFTQVTSMDGGLNAWRAAGYPIEP